ncbi:MAG: PilZ domain-containing protein [Thermodesulfobacteriota bacterium]
MEKTEIYEGPEKRQSVRFEANFPVVLKLYVRGRTGIITTLINGETANISLEGICVQLGLSDYMDIISLVEAAMNKIGVDVGLELIVGGMNFTAIGEIMWFRKQGEDHLRIGIHFMGMNRDDRSMWNRVLFSLGEKAQTAEASTIGAM